MAKRGQGRPFTVRFRFEGSREWALGSFVTREAAEFARDQQAARIGPAGQTCEAWVVDRNARYCRSCREPVGTYTPAGTRELRAVNHRIPYFGTDCPGRFGIVDRTAPVR